MSSKRVRDTSSKDASRAGSPVTTRSETSSSGKAPSPSDQTPRAQVDFQFLNFSHPQEAKGSRARRAVRSHVTRQQHQREHAAAAARRLQSEQQEADERSSNRPTTASGSSSSSDEDESQSPSPTTSAPSTPVRVDIREMYAESWLLYIPRILDHYLGVMASGMAVSGADDTELRSQLRLRFFPLIMTDAAALHCMLLTSTAHYQNIHGARSHPIDLLQLRGTAFREINQAIHDSARATSDQLIAAIANLASYEGIYSDRAAFNTHMTGLQRMVTLRGGLPSLGMEGLLERILLWVDANATSITSLRLYFDRNAFPTRSTHPRPNPRHFRGSDD